MVQKVLSGMLYVVEDGRCHVIMQVDLTKEEVAKALFSSLIRRAKSGVPQQVVSMIMSEKIVDIWVMLERDANHSAAYAFAFTS